MIIQFYSFEVQGFVQFHISNGNNANFGKCVRIFSFWKGLFGGGGGGDEKEKIVKMVL